MNIASLVSTIAVFLWVGFVVVLILVVVAAWRGRPIKKGSLIILVIGAVAIATSLLSAGLVWVNPEERGMVISALAAGRVPPRGAEPGLALHRPLCGKCGALPDLQADLYHVHRPE